MEDSNLYIETTESEKEVNNPTYSIIRYFSIHLPESYRALIFSKWLRSLRYGNPLFKKMSPKEYYKSYHFYIENLLRKPDSVIMLAVLSDDHDVVLGFSASREDVLDYIHVHRDYRKVGIGKALLPDEITTFTHLTLTALNIWQAKAKYKGWKFDPFT